MDKLVQQDRPIGVQTVFGPDVLALTAFSGTESLSSLFSFDLQMISLKGDLKPKQILGSSISFWVRHQDEKERWFNGIVNSFAYMGMNDRVHLYQAQVVPRLWLLTRGSDCAVHETAGKQNAKDIVEALLKKCGITDFQMKILRTLPFRDYCLQYRETHFDFISRLLEEEGIYYYFIHEQGKHTLCLTDHPEGSYDLKDAEVSLKEKLSFVSDLDYLKQWKHEYDFVSGKWTVSDYDFKKSQTDLTAHTTSKVSLTGNASLEFYDFPGDFQESADGTSLSKLRMEEEECSHESVAGTSIARSFSPGGRFMVKQHHVAAEQKQKWMLTTVEHHAKLGGGYYSGVGDADEIYSNSFRCIPEKTVFRPPRLRQKPRVMGLHSAIVTGKSGEEIWTDEYGRVKIQFPWDRVGEKNEKSSMWVRVATPWAGKNWGMIHIPRIGQEVLVSFLEGDPDRPIVMGMLYNNANKPPYSLPDNQTQSGIKTRSSKEGTAENFNELRFEDKKGEEQVYVHAEKNLDCVIENNETRKVGFDKKDAGNQTIEVFNNQILKVGTPECPDGNQTIEVFKDRKATLKTGDDALTVEQGSLAVAIKLGNMTTKLDAGSSSTDAGQAIELVVGANSIKIDQSGITIKGIMITVEGTAKADLKSPMTSVQGDGMLKVAGGVLMIN